MKLLGAMPQSWGVHDQQDGAGSNLVTRRMGTAVNQRVQDHYLGSAKVVSPQRDYCRTVRTLHHLGEQSGDDGRTLEDVGGSAQLHRETESHTHTGQLPPVSYNIPPSPAPSP